MLEGELAARIRQAIGREPRSAKSVHGLDQLPPDVLDDIEVINGKCGGLYVFAYLYHVTDATFGDVKLYIAERGWLHSAD